MRSIIARESNVSPTGMSYFTGAIEVARGGDSLSLIPAISWFIAEAFVLPTEAAAFELAELLSIHGVGHHGFVALPYLGGA
jgi:hypothetical protein